MRELVAQIGPWPVAVVCVAVAILCPIAAARRLTPDLLRESYVIHKPGRVIATAVLLLVILGVAGAVVAVIAVAYPFLWAVEATIVSGAGVVVLHLVRFHRAARAYDGRGIGDGDGDRDPTDA